MDNRLAAILLVLVMLACMTDVKAYNHKQISHLQAARGIGELYNVPETLQAIILQESSAGIDKLGDDGESLGLAHVTVPAAKDVLTLYCSRPSKKKQCSILHYDYKDDHSLRAHLAAHDDLNLIFAVLYFQMHYEYYKEKQYSLPWSRAVISHNTGYKPRYMSTEEVENHVYLGYIRTRIKAIRSFKKRNKGLWI
jgi:hypothetical protein